MAIESQLFRDIMSNFASGVTVVTALSRDGEPSGLTVSAFSSVSLQPPLVLVCVEKTSTTLPAIEHSRGFTVNFLEAGRDDLSQHFASKDERKFDGISWRPATTPEAGPVLDSGIFASVECSVHQAVEAGDHWIFVGEVRSGALTPAPRPLVHWTRRYWKLAE